MHDRIERLMSAVRRHLPGFSFREPEGGYTLFVTSDDPELDDPELDELDVLECATDLGTSFDPVVFSRDEAPRRFAMRLSSCNVPEASIEEAVRRLARAVSMSSSERRSAPRAARAATP